MKIQQKLSLCGAIIFGLLQSAYPIPYYVATNGSDAVGTAGTSWDTAFLTISNAVFKAQTNMLNSVVVSNGTYQLTAAYISITNGITVQALSTNAADTLVNGMGTYLCFRLSHTNAMLSGFTISNGYDTSLGGGIWFQKGTITNCVIKNCTSSLGGGAYMYSGSTLTHCEIIYNLSTNTSGSGGGGVYLSESNCTVASCRIAFNLAYDGGGVQVESGGTVTDCDIHDNIATNYGGGLAVRGGNNLIVRNCTVSNNMARAQRGGGVSLNGSAGSTVLANSIICNNSAGRGGGVYVTGSYGEMRNCLLCHNVSPFGSYEGGGLYINNGYVENCTIVSNYATTAAGRGGVHNRGGGTPYSGGGKLRNTIVWYNVGQVASNYYDDAGGGTCTNCFVAPTNSYGANNSSADPLFVDKDTGNFRLQGSSPCINAGVNQEWMNNAVDLDGHKRLDYFKLIVDVGAYEFLPRGTMLTTY